MIVDFALFKLSGLGQNIPVALTISCVRLSEQYGTDVCPFSNAIIARYDQNYLQR